MIVYSIDIETTGLCPTKDQVLSLGCVKFNLFTGEILQTYEVLVRHLNVYGGQRYSGNPIALSMNANILKRLGEHDGQGLDIVDHDDLMEHFKSHFGLTMDDRITAAGKNFGAFDQQFLEELDFDFFKHRSLDPAILYIQDCDEKVPNLDMCCERGSIHVTGSKRHTALEDASLVAQLLIHWWATK